MDYKEPMVEELKKRLHLVAAKSSRRKAALKQLMKAYDAMYNVARNYSDRNSQLLRQIDAIRDKVIESHTPCAKFHLF